MFGINVARVTNAHNTIIVEIEWKNENSRWNNQIGDNSFE